MYYLFVIKDEYYRKNDSYLYYLLENLKYLNIENYNYGFSIYHSICYFFNTSILENYVFKKYHLEPINGIYYLDNDKTIMKFSRSYCYIKTNKHLRELLCIFYIYHKNIFVCNFEKKEFFWLKDLFCNKYIK